MGFDTTEHECLRSIVVLACHGCAVTHSRPLPKSTNTMSAPSTVRWAVVKGETGCSTTQYDRYFFAGLLASAT